MLKVLAAGATDIGSRRRYNEDAIDWWVADDKSSALAVLADGMGGYEGGEVASRLAVEACLAVLGQLKGVNDHSPAVIEAALTDAIAHANRRIRDARRLDAERSRMGTTLVVVWIQGELAYIAHVGDSRCYRLSGERVEQLTRDDTVVQKMLDDGSIRSEDVSQVPFRNILTKAVGAEPTVTPTLLRLPVAAGERLLLCSDGLPGALSPTEWHGVTGGKASLATQVRNLIAASLAQEANDNVSVILLGFDSSGAQSPPHQTSENSER